VGKLVVLEGIDGSGKSTLVSKLKSRLPDAMFTREPTSSIWGKRLREKLSGKEVSSSFEQLFLRDRLYHNRNFIKPNLENFDFIFSDRYYFSTAAYQGENEENAMSIAEKYSQYARIVKPNIVIFLNLPVSESLKRIRARNLPEESFEKEQELYRIAKNYNSLAMHYSFKTFDALEEPDLIADKIIEELIKE
jgi:dTMP kinase